MNLTNTPSEIELAEVVDALRGTNLQGVVRRLAFHRDTLESELARVREQNHRLRNVLSGPGNAIVGYAQSATLLQGYANWSTALIEYADRLGEAIDRELAAEVEG